MSELQYWIVVLFIAGLANMLLGIGTASRFILWWGFGCFGVCVVLLGVYQNVGS